MERKPEFEPKKAISAIIKAKQSNIPTMGGSAVQFQTPTPAVWAGGGPGAGGLGGGGSKNFLHFGGHF